MNEPQFRSIARSLTGTIWRLATLCALLIALVQTIVSYKSVQDEFQLELRQIGLTYVPLISSSIWDIEPNVVQWQLDNLSQRSTIGFVRLKVETGQMFIAGRKDLAEGEASRRFDVPPPDRSVGTIGTLEVYANPAAFYAEWAYNVGVSVLVYGFLTMLICFVVSYMLRRDLENPMRQIAQFVANLSPESLTAPLALERKNHRGKDEIDLVVEGFRVLQEGIDRHIGNLDHLVRLRTAEVEEAMVSIRRLSQIDTLTGCFNRRFFNEQIGRELERAARYNRSLSVLFCDIDHFKQINDSYGHLAGDEVLKAVAGEFLADLRSSVDWVARYGGEEFVIVLPENGLDEACVTAERLRHKIAETLVVPVADQDLRVTVSFGVAQYEFGLSAAQLLEAADQELYKAKAAGRNRVSAPARAFLAD
ncbi:diguanylate cyclase [Azonexus sp. IMCC34839]|uniref:sensor domain-containing diguanylate cyclase n=1 Tax=Azonexus sp. IMCC34839 TaxID=3133695 RepID=UPI003999F8A6